MKNKLRITIFSAKHLEEYKIEFTFSDGKINVFDYKNLVMRNHEESIPYRDIENFKVFTIINGTEIAWGENFDMILPFNTIYNKSEFSISGRKKVSDKKIVLRLYVKQSVIDANGGIELAQQKCTDMLNETFEILC